MFDNYKVAQGGEWGKSARTETGWTIMAILKTDSFSNLSRLPKLDFIAYHKSRLK